MEAVPANLADADAIAGLVARHKERFGRLDVLVNNAGVGIGATATDHEAKHIDLQLGVNVRAIILLYREAIEMLRAAGAEHGNALVVNLASLAGKSPQPWLSVYSATKAAVVAYTNAMNKELNADGVKSVAFCPGFVDTDMSEFVKGTIPAEEMLTTATWPRRCGSSCGSRALRRPGDRVPAAGRSDLAPASASFSSVSNASRAPVAHPATSVSASCTRAGSPRSAGSAGDAWVPNAWSRRSISRSASSEGNWSLRCSGVDNPCSSASDVARARSASYSRINSASDPSAASACEAASLIACSSEMIAWLFIAAMVTD